MVFQQNYVSALCNRVTRLNFGRGQFVATVSLYSSLYFSHRKKEKKKNETERVKTDRWTWPVTFPRFLSGPSAILPTCRTQFPVSPIVAQANKCIANTCRWEKWARGPLFWRAVIVSRRTLSQWTCHRYKPRNQQPRKPGYNTCFEHTGRTTIFHRVSFPFALTYTW